MSIDHDCGCTYKDAEYHEIEHEDGSVTVCCPTCHHPYPLDHDGSGRPCYDADHDCKTHQG